MASRAAAMKMATISALVLLVLLSMGTSPVTAVLDCSLACRDPCNNFADGFCTNGGLSCGTQGSLACHTAAFQACVATCVDGCTAQKFVPCT